MRLLKFLATVVLSISLCSCSCEDVNLGKMEFTNDLISFLPVQPAQGKSYYLAIDDADQKMQYINPSPYTSVIIPVRKINYSGKLDPNSCKEYYTAEQKVYTTQTEGESPVRITLTYRKNVSTDRFNDHAGRDNVSDVIEFLLGYNNKFPAPINSGSTKIESYTTQRYFILEEASASRIDKIMYVQEFLPTITLDGITYENMYHLHMKEQPAYRPEEQYYLESYPQLDYVQGIYIKEGLGVVKAYTYRGKQIDITIE